MYTDNLDSFIKSKKMPSADILIYKDHKEIYRGTFGTKDAEGKIPLRGDELYFLYSATKPITCVGAMRLVERGVISIDDPVYKYIPEYKDLTYLDKGEVKKCTKVMTIRHLFAMRGGLTYNLNMPSFKELVAREPDAGTVDVVKSFAATPLSFEPGTRYQYSLCHDVLGAVIEVASGMKFGEYMKKEVFEPLGMTKTTFHVTDDMLPQFATQYRLENGEYTPVPLTCVYKLTKNYESGGAGLVSCVDDYIKFADAMANNGKAANGYQLLRPETVDLMRVNQNEVNLLLPGPVRPGLGYGFGMRMMIDKRLANSNAPCEFEFGWDGAAGTYVTMDAHHHICAVYFQHVLGHGWVYTDVHPVIRDTAYRLAGLV